MTGFARSDGAYNGIRWHWELRTVNGRGLEVRLRLPPGYEAIEQEVRKICANKLVRGNCMISLSTRREGKVGEIQLNEAGLLQIAEAVTQAQELVDAAPPTLDGLLGLKGVLEIAEADESEEEQAERHKLMLSDFTNAIEEIVTSREEEGQRLSFAMAGQLDQIQNLVHEAENAPARKPEAIQVKLAEQVRRLLDTSGDLDPDRLHQEAVLLATKADIEEELERLKSHIVAGRELLEATTPVGRKLEFLAQEFNREANTICSKSNDTELTQIGLALKAVIEQLREQVQNIE